MTAPAKRVYTPTNGRRQRECTSSGTENAGYLNRYVNERAPEDVFTAVVLQMLEVVVLRFIHNITHSLVRTTSGVFSMTGTVILPSDVSMEIIHEVLLGLPLSLSVLV